MKIGPYEVVAQVGRGGMGSVLRARDPALPGREVAVKVLSSSGRPTERALARFEREVQALATANHPNVVRLHGCGMHGDSPYYVMELVDGRPLGALAAPSGLEPRRAAKIVREIADAVAYVHERGVLHRDLKPDNVIVQGDDRPRLCDFGLAYVANAGRLTKTGALIGTPAFAPPELLEGNADNASPAVDVYGLGAVLFYSLVGQAPFDADTVMNLLAKVQNQRATAPSKLRRGVPRDLDRICLRALEKEPVLRYLSVADMREDLDRFLRGEPVVAGQSSVTDFVRRAARRPAARIAAMLVAAFAAIGAGTLHAFHRLDESRAEMARVYDEALADGQTVAGVKERRDKLALLQAPKEQLDRVEARVAALELAERLRAIAVPEPSVAALLAAAEAATRSEANLVGEGLGPALGDALLDATSRVSSGEGLLLVRAASELAKARLAKDGNDAAARALRAYVSLADVGAPRRPLGPGKLGLAPSADILGDLAAARELRGAPGQRAAWLLVDLLATARRDAEARAALEAARAAPIPEAEALERLVTTPQGEEGLATVFAKIRDAKDARLAALELARHFARSGALGAIDHPELASATSLATLEAAVAAEPAPAFVAVPPRDVEAHTLVQAATKPINEAALKDEELLGAAQRPEALIRSRFASRREESLALLARAVRKAPRDPHVIGDAFQPIFGRVTCAVFAVLRSRHESHGAISLYEAFDAGGRARGVNSYARVYGERWDSAKTGLAACEEFDARIAEDAREDPLVRAAVEGGVPEEEVRLACEGMAGLRRLEALVEEESSLDARERDRLAAGALLRIEALVRMAGPGGLLLRARARRVGLPRPVRGPLVALDLLRLLRVAPPDPKRQTWKLLVLGASEAAACEDATEQRILAHRLYKQTLAWEHEECLYETAAELFKRTKKNAFDEAVAWATGDRYLGPLFTEVDEPRLQRDFAETPEDRRRLGEGYVFQMPVVLGRPK